MSAKGLEKFLKIEYNIQKRTEIPKKGGLDLDKAKLARISELTKISRERELTPEETEERAALRQEYLAEIKASLKSQLDNIEIVD